MARTPTAYCTAAEARDWVGISSAIGREDDRLELAVKAASRAVDRACGRTFTKDDAPVARSITAVNPLRLALPDVAEAAGLIVSASGITWTGADYVLGPNVDGIDPYTGEMVPFTQLGAIGQLTFPRGAGYPADQVSITAVWGWPAVPDAVKLATMISAADLYALKNAPHGVAGFGDYGAVRVRSNPKVWELIAPYARGNVFLGGH